MPTRQIYNRALTSEFRSYLDRRGAWPPLKAFPKALEDKGGGRKGEISRMKAGGSVAEKYVLALVELLRDKQALADFLQVQRPSELDGWTGAAILDRIAGPITVAPEPNDLDVDWHLKGLEGLVGIFTDFIWGELVRPGTLCKDEQEVRLAVSMLMASVGRQLCEPNGTALPAEKAIELASDHMQISLDDYHDRVVKLWRVQPWSLVFAVVDRQRVGCSLIAPLNELAYQQIREGKRSPHELNANDVAIPSHSVFLEAVGHRSNAEYPAVGRKTLQTVRTIYVQLAHLTLEPAGDRDPDFRTNGSTLSILSLAGTSENERRLKRNGFRKTGTRLCGFEIDLMELDEKKGWFTQMVVEKLQKRLLETGRSPRRRSRSS